MSRQPQDDDRALEAWLARELRQRQAYIDDAGFTDRVMSALPAPAPERRWPVWFGVLLAGLGAGLLALALVPTEALMASPLPLMALLQVGAFAMAVLVTAVAGWVWLEGPE